MNKLFGKNYLITVLVLSLLSVVILVSLLYLDKIINLISFSLPSLTSWQKNSKSKSVPVKKKIASFKDTKLWKNIVADYKYLGLENAHPQALFRPGTIKEYEIGKSITFITVNNKEYTFKTDDLTGFYVPTEYVIDGVEQISYRSKQMSIHTAYKYYIKPGATIFVEANSPEGFGGEYSGSYSVLFVDR